MEPFPDHPLPSPLSLPRREGVVREWLLSQPGEHVENGREIGRPARHNSHTCEGSHSRVSQLSQGSQPEKGVVAGPLVGPSEIDMSTGTVKLSDQERAIFLKVLQHGCLTLHAILRWFSPGDLDLPAGKRPNLYFRLNVLVRAGYLAKREIGGQQVYLLRRPGLEAIKESNTYGLPLASGRELGTVNHDLIGADLRCYLESHGATEWVSDREFRHVASGMLQIPDSACTVKGRAVFLEVELSQKTRDRYDKIASIYTRPKGPDRVVYFYRDRKVVEYLMELVSGHPRLGFFPYADPLPSPDDLLGNAGGEEISLGDFLGCSRGGRR